MKKKVMAIGILVVLILSGTTCGGKTCAQERREADDCFVTTLLLSAIEPNNSTRTSTFLGGLLYCDSKLSSYCRSSRNSSDR